MIRTLALLLVCLLVLVAVVGMPLLLLSPMHHEIGCPFAMGEAAICSMSVFDHIRNWQIAFVAICAEILLIAALALAPQRLWRCITLPQLDFAHVRIRNHSPARPTLLQELYSRGILNRKEPRRF